MAEVTTQGFDQADASLAKLPLEVRGRKLQNAMRRTGTPVRKRAKTLIPPPGYPGDKPELKPLRDTLRTLVRTYEGVMIAVTGPRYPEGAHGVLVEGATADGTNVDVHHHSRGEPTGVILEKNPFIGPAAEATKSQQEQILVDALRKAAEG